MIIFGNFNYELSNVDVYVEGDLKFYLSGGIANKRKELSLGGLPSNKEIIDSINNLFATVEERNSNVYRCGYIINSGDSIVRNVNVSLDDILIDVGFAKETAVQELIFTGVTTGTFTLKYTRSVNGSVIQQETAPISFSVDMDSDIQGALNSLDYLSEVVVSDLVITFSGINDFRYQYPLEVVNSTDGNIEVNVIANGSPMNAVAVNIGYENQSPANVEFSQTSDIGIMFPLDGFAFWLKRSIPSDTESEVYETFLNVNADVD